MLAPVLAFTFEFFLLFLVWAVLLVMNLWMFQKTKGKGNLLMMLGAGGLALAALLWSFDTVSAFVVHWLPLIGAVLLVIGFYFTAKPVIDVHIDALKKKLKDVTAEKKAEEKAGGGGEGGES